MFGGNFGGASTFGGGGFTAPATSTSVFGQPQQQPANTSLFGGGGFGQPKAPTFGTSTFGASTSGSMFGSGNRLQAPATGGLFGNQTATVSPFSATGTAQAGTSIPFAPITGSDTMMKNGQATSISTRHQCITCMKEYENKSLEELRLEDYQLNRKGPQQGQSAGLFGATQPQQSSGGLFSSLSGNTTTSPFGQTGAFGAATSTGGGGGGLFGSFGQPKTTAGGFFSTPATSTGFGGTSTSAFSFNNNPVSQATTSVFGTNTNPVSTGGMSASPFSFNTNTNTTGGLFGQKPATSTTTTGFGTAGAFGATAFGANTSTANKPLGFGTGFGTTTTQASAFGTSAPTFGSGTGTSLFGAPQAAKPFSFGSSFTSQPQSTAPTFGAPSGTSAFSFNTAPTSTPSLGFGSATNTFGTPASTSFATPGFGTSQPTGGFSFGMTTSAPTFSSFTTQNFGQTTAQQQNTLPPPTVGISTTPYKDSHLFYNLVTNRDIDSLIKPTSPAAQRAIKEASRRRTSTGLSFSFSSPTQPRPVSSPAPKSLNASIFDGFEDEEYSSPLINLDILSPKSSVKKLNLKSKTSTPSNHRHSISFGVTRNDSFNEGGLNDSINGQFDLNNSRVNNSNKMTSTPERDSSNAPMPIKFSEEITIVRDASSAQKRNSDAAERQLNGGIEVHACGVVNSRPGYYIHPPIETLDKLVDENGNCFVKGLVIGRQNHGEIRFSDMVNVAGINIDEIVFFRHKEVVVYPDDSVKPSLGNGLNCPAEVSLERVWPIDKETKDPVRNPQQLANMGYENVLRKACSRLGAEFVSYTPEAGAWVFKVPHFSKYSCDLEETEADISTSQTATVLPPPIAGLGGYAIPQKTMGSTGYPAAARISAYRQSGAPTNEGTHPPGITQSNELVVGEVEHNPLTPSESNDSDTEWIQEDLESENNSQYESVFKTKAENSAVRLMKSALMNYDQFEPMEEEIQPPMKKAKNPAATSRPNESVAQSVEIRISSSKQQKIAAELKQQKPGPAPSLLMTIQRKDERQKTTTAEVSSMFSNNYVKAVVRKQEVRLTKEPTDTIVHLSSASCRRYKSATRVSFGPFGTFLTVHSSKQMKSPAVVIQRVPNLAVQMSNPIYMEAVSEQLKKQLNWNNMRVQHQIEALWDILSAYKSPAKTEFAVTELVMWELFHILWSSKPVSNDPEEQVLIIRDEVENWFSKNCMELFPSLLGKHPERSVLGLLKMGKREDACALAVKTFNPCIAMLICQSASARETCSNCEEQLSVWAEEGALAFLSEEMQLIYRLCAGLPILNQADINKMTTEQWLQHFALYLWYSCPSNVPIEEAVASFQQMLRYDASKIESDLYGSVQTAFPSNCDSSVPNLCVHLFKLYSFDGYPLRNVLDPVTYTTNCLDYKLSWLVMVYLRSRGQPVPEDVFSNIATAFAGQLEQLGMFTWSAFVMDKTSERVPYHRSVVERNLGTWGNEEDEKFLLDYALLQSPEVLYNARIIRETYSTSVGSGKVWYMIKAGNVHKAFKELLQHFSVDTILSNDSIQSFLDLLGFLSAYSDILRNWSGQGQFLRDALQLVQIKQVSADYGLNSNDDNLEHIGEIMQGFLKSFKIYNPSKPSESAIAIEMSVMTQKIIAEMASSDPNFLMTMGASNLDSLLDIPIPPDYRNELCAFIKLILGESSVH